MRWREGEKLHWREFSEDLKYVNDVLFKIYKNLMWYIKFCKKSCLFYYTYFWDWGKSKL